MQRQNVVFLCTLLLLSVIVLLNADLGWHARRSRPQEEEAKLSVEEALRAYPAQDLYYPREESGQPTLTKEGRRHSHPPLDGAVDLCPTVSGVGCLRGPVVLLHQGRCGSSVLLDMLGWRTQDIRSLRGGDLFFPADPTPEVFRYLKPYPPSADLNNAELYSDSHRASREEMDFHVQQLQEILQRSHLTLPERTIHGVTVNEGYPILSLKLYQIEQAKMRVDDYLWALAEVGAKHLVVLHRSYVRVYVSSRMAKETGKFANSNKNQQVRCPDERFTDDWEYRASVWERLDREYQLALTHPAFPNRLALSYETNIYEDPSVAANMVNKFLGRDGPDVTLQMYRTSDCPLRDAILDFDNLAAALQGTSRAYMLEPEGRQVPLPPVEVTVGLLK